MTDASNFVIKRIGTYDLSGTRLGKGNFAFVELATNRVTKSKVAVKVIDTRKIKDEYVKRNILREALLLKKIHHPNIVKLYETLKQRTVYCLVTEYIAGGELLGLIRSQHDSKLSELQARPIVRQIVSALHHLQEQGIVHRDLKMENILLDESKKNIKIVDFGLSNKFNDNEFLKTQCGSPEYAAPELFKKGCRYGPEVDLWSLGIITFGMVVGKLPFRTPHSGGRGRNDLVDQMTRGLSSLHSKYMANLSPECRDLLRKLLEPNPQLRLPLLDVMVHPWLTLKGTLPLVPYAPPVIDLKIIDKVLDKVSSLTKMPRSKIQIHMVRNRYDTLSGIYHLILDDEIRQMNEREKTITKNRKERHVAWSTTGMQNRKSINNGQSTDEIIKVCIKQGNATENCTKGEENLEICTKTTETYEESNKENKERMWPRKQSSHVGSSKSKGALDSLQIRGLKMFATEHQVRKKSACARTRPNSAERTKVAAKCHRRSVSGSAAGRSHSVNPCEVPDELHGKRLVLSPRSATTRENYGEETQKTVDDTEETQKNVEACEATQPEDAKRTALEEVKEDDGSPTGITGNQEKANNRGNATCKEKPVRHRSAVTREQHVVATVSGMAWGDRSSDLQKRPTKSPRHFRSAPKARVGTQAKVNAQTDVTSVVSGQRSYASQCQDRRTPDDVQYDWTDYRKFFTQSAKTSRPRRLGDVTHSVGKSEKDLAEQITWSEDNNGKITDNMYVIYQRYLANCKPHHKRLSIMQAQEILQHDYKFHAKYGRKNSPDVNEKEEGGENSLASGNEEKSHPEESSKTQKGVRREKRPQSSVKTSSVNGVTLREEHRELVLHATQCSWMKNAIQESGLLNKECDSKVGRSSDDETHCSNIEGKKTEILSSKQEESLKRQKQKELKEEVEREQKRIDRELQDTERVKLIEQYLDDIYTRYGVNTTTLQLDGNTTEKEHPSRSFKTTHKGKLYSWLPRKQPHGKSSGLMTKPASILHASHQSPTNMAHGDKKIVFKEQHANKIGGNTNIRFFNDWSKTAFINYVNSEGEFKVDERDQDLSLQLQLKDASYWLQRHLSGVVAKTSAKATTKEPPIHAIPRQT